MAWNPVQTFNFTGTDGTPVESVHGSLSLTWGGSGYLVVRSGKLVTDFSDPDPRLARDTGTYTNDQYCKATLGGFTGAGTGRYHVIAVQVSTDTGANSDFYALIIYNDSGPRTSEIAKFVNGSYSSLISSTAIAWADGDVALLQIVSGVLTAYRNGVATALTHTDGSPLTGGKPGFGTKDGSSGNTLTLDDAETGDVTTDTTAPVLTSPTGTQTGSTTAQGTVVTDEANGTLYTVVSTSTTNPSVAQIQAGQIHTGAAAPYSTSQAISSTGTKTFNATGLSPSTTYYFHYQHRDAATNDSTVVNSAGFTTSSGSGDILFGQACL